MTGRLGDWLSGFGLPAGGSDARIAWPDIVLALGCTAVTQYWLIQRADYWAYAALWLAGYVGFAPMLIAIRRIDPALALGGLVLGAYLWSLLAGDVAWPLLLGCLLVLWSLPTRWGIGSGLTLTGVLALLPVLTDRERESLLVRVYPHLYMHFRGEDGQMQTWRGLAEVAWDRVQAARWPWWASVVMVLACAAAMLIQRRRGVVPFRRTAGERVEDLLGVVRRNDDLPFDVLLGAALTSPVLVELWWDKVVNGNWWTAPGWMPWAVAFAPMTLVVRRRWPALPVVVLGIAALVSYWQTDEVWSVLLALAVALYSLKSVVWSVPAGVAVLAALPAIAALIRYPQMVLIFPKVADQPFIVDFEGRLRNTIYDEMVDRQWPISLSLSLLVPLCAGIAARLYRRNREAARREAELEQEALERDAEQVVLSERSHIARDLHDVVAHAVNLMLILTTFDLDEYVYDALRAGASGFLLKRSSRDELINAVRVIAAGDALLAPPVTRRLIDRFAETRLDPEVAARLDVLTAREREVLVLVAKGNSNAEIAAELHLTEHTVKTHVSRMLTKTGLRDRVPAVILAYDAGLVAAGQR